MKGMPNSAVISFKVPASVERHLVGLNHTRSSDQEEWLIETDIKTA